jgi:predicted ATP-binding protein involved in virulence
MEIKSIRLINVGRFEDLEIALSPTENCTGNTTVFVGNNGAGKTSLLKSIATSLSWFVSRIRSEKGNGSPVPEDVILNGQNSASIELEVLDAHVGKSFTWAIAKTRAGRKAVFQTHLSSLSALTDIYRTRLSDNDKTALPLIAFYPVERAVLDIPLKIREKHSFTQLDGYDNSLSQGVDFRRFFEWFREREDSENEQGFTEESVEAMVKILGGDHESIVKINELRDAAKDKQLSAVRIAIHHFMPGFTNMRVRRKPRLHMSIDKQGKTLSVSQLSQGEKSLMALVGDIARRLAIMNPDSNNPLSGDGIILIDEVDMHLHPQWQRSLIERLTSTFPNCQFILSTHSPLVISDYKDVLVYSLENGQSKEVSTQYGQDANSVLLDVMDTDIRNSRINIRLNDLLDAIHDKKIDAARAIINELETILPASNIELIRARLLLRKQELRREES